MSRQGPTPVRALRLAIVSSHPIQYNAPLFRHIAQRADIVSKVFYSWEGTARSADREFGHSITWDIPLLEGYEWELIPNEAADPGTHHFGGLHNPDMARRLEAWGPDALLVYGWASRTHLEVLRHFKGRTPILFRGDSTLQSGGKGLRRLIRFPVLRWIYSHVDLALYPGRRNREYLQWCGLDGQRTAWMPHCVENDRFSTDPSRLAAAERARQRLGIKADDIAFGFAGKLVQRKQVAVLIQAFQTAQWPGKPPHLIITGSGPLEGDLRRLAAGDDRVHFQGFRNQSEMPIAYRMCDVFVLPSSEETWGLAVNEAMASARPVVVSDRVGCAPDLASGSEFARSFPAGDVASLSRTLADLAVDRRQLHEMGQRGLDFIGGWSVDAAADQLCAAVRSVCTDEGRMPSTGADE